MEPVKLLYRSKPKTYFFWGEKSVGDEVIYEFADGMFVRTTITLVEDYILLAGSNQPHMVYWCRADDDRHSSWVEDLDTHTVTRMGDFLMAVPNSIVDIPSLEWDWVGRDINIEEPIGYSISDDFFGVYPSLDYAMSHGGVSRKRDRNRAHKKYVTAIKSRWRALMNNHRACGATYEDQEKFVKLIESVQPKRVYLRRK